MLRGSLRVLPQIGAVLLSVALAAPAMAAASITVTDAQLLPGGSSVQLTVDVVCGAPAGATSYLSTTIWEGSYTRPHRYLEGQGQTEVVCDGVSHTYSFTATTTVFYADKRFTLGKAFTESGVQYCVRIDETNTQCTPIDPQVRQTVHIHR
jgi:hypothetical protein